MHTRTLIILATCLAIPEGARALQTPIQTPRVDTEVNVGATRIHDPYAWLENSSTEAVLEWARAQDAYTRYVMGRTRRGTAIDSFMSSHPARRGQLGAPHERSGVWFFTRRTPGEGRRIVRSTGSTATEQTLPVEGIVALGWGAPMIWPDPSGDRVVAGLGVSGGSTRHLTLAIVDGETGVEVAPRIEGITTRSRVHWLPDGGSFIYTGRTAGDTASSSPLHIFRYDVASAQSRLVYADPEGVDGLTYWTVLGTDADAVSFSETAGPTQRLLRVPLSGTDEPLVVLADSRNAFPIGESAGRLFVVSTDDAPMGQVLSFSTQEPCEGTAVVPEDPEARIVRGRFFGGRIVLQVYHRGKTEIRIFDPETGAKRTVALPYIGWMGPGITGTPWSDSFGFQLEGLVDPGSTYTVALDDGGPRLFAALEPDLDHDDYVTRSETYRSFDGVEVPIFLSYRRDSPPTTTTPVWLYGYGAGGFADVPWHQVQHRAFLDAGGLYAMPGVRGGGAGGAGWQEAGEGRNKQVGILDYIAAAEWLVAEGMADSDRIVANGNSAGGRLVASAVLQRPDLFAALMADFSRLDMVRPMPAGGQSWGDTNDPAGLAAILEWSPYSLAQREGCYPPTFVGHGDQDRSVNVFHSYKFAAALQHSQRCDNPIFLQVGWGFGHTLGGKSEQANQLAFLRQVLGLEF